MPVFTAGIQMGEGNFEVMQAAEGPRRWSRGCPCHGVVVGDVEDVAEEVANEVAVRGDAVGPHCD
jgi:hypothetical protein